MKQKRGPAPSCLTDQIFMAATHKKAWIVLRNGDRKQGYVDPDSLPEHDPVQWLDLQGQIRQTGQDDILQIWIVRDFQDPLPLDRKKFSSRPRQPGLWVQLQNQLGDRLEALLANDLLSCMRFGFLLLAPGGLSRFYVPRSALLSLAVLGVIGAPKPGKAAVTASQIRLFPPEPGENDVL